MRRIIFKERMNSNYEEGLIVFSPLQKTSAAVGIILCLFSFAFAYSGGSGEPNDPYQISSVSDWNDLMNTTADWNKHFILINDLDLQGVALTPVGDYNLGDPNRLFTGVFDGSGYIIRNADINKVVSYYSHLIYIGLFGCVDSNGQIRNLGVEDVNIHAGGRAGGLAGKNYGTITACYTTGTVTGLYSVIGGLVGVNVGTIGNCYSSATVISGSGSISIGGLAGSNVGGTITNCYATGAVSGTEYVGGLVGYNMEYMDSIGGIITYCYASGTVSGSSRIGGLVGQSEGTIITCYAAGAVTGNKDYVGGLVGSNYYYSTISTITNCYATGAVSGGSHVGGLVGVNNDTVTDCYAVGAVTGDDYVGGLMGYNRGGTTTNCCATGAVVGKNYVGGLVGDNGYNYGGIITACYATGAVTGSGYVGGLVGRNIGTIAACYTTGAVTGIGYVGGLVGAQLCQWISSKVICGNTTASFWDVQTSGRTTSAGGTGLITAWMKKRSTFTSARWDFVGETANGTKDTWTICEGVNYPKFVWQNQPPIAEAGEDQTAYAWIDGIAEVDLDGLGSSDPDCNELTYYWNWVIDGNTYEANGVNPTIELPVGVHTIQLIVNDGLADSAVDDVNITVISPLKSALGITPRIINRNSRQSYIFALVRMPNGIMKKDISNEPLTLYPGEIEASRQWIVSIPYGFGRNKKWLTEIFAFFDKDAVVDAIPTNGKVKLKVAGELTSGRYFYGSDTVIIIGPRRPWHFPKR
jgi:hypothetical protein